MTLTGLKVVELEKTIPIVEDEEAIRSLNVHPGFLMLAQRMRNQKAILKGHLEQGKHESLREVDVLQAGLRWLGYLEAEVNRAVGKKREVPEVKPSPDQLDDFKKVYAQIESV